MWKLGWVQLSWNHYEAGLQFNVKTKRCVKYRVLVLLKDKPVHFSCFEGPDEEQQKVEPHHIVVFGDGDCVKFQNKVSFIQWD